MHESQPFLPPSANAAPLPPPPPPGTAPTGAPSVASPQAWSPTALPTPPAAATPASAAPESPTPTISLPDAAPGASPWAPNATPGDADVPVLEFTPPEPPRRSRRTLMLAIAAVCALAVGVGGFFALSGDSGTEDSVTYVTDPDSSDAYSFARATETVDAAAALRLTMDMAAPGTTMEMTGAVDRGSRRFSMDMATVTDDDMFGFGDMTFSMIADDPTSTIYMSGELLSSFYGADTPWVSMTEEFVGGDGMDAWFDQPLELATIFAGYEPVELGIDDIDGEQLKHFTVTITLEDLLAEDPDAVTGFGTADLTSLDEITYDVWIDADSRLRRISMDLDVAGEQVSMDMRLEHLAEPIEIALPDPADVTDWETAISAGAWGDLETLDD